MKRWYVTLFLIAGCLTAEAQSGKTECLHDLATKASNDSYKVYKRDTLIQFNDGINTYAIQSLLKSRNDTVVKVDDLDLELHADSLTESIYPIYRSLKIPITPRIDTLRDPDNYSTILNIDTVDSISVWYAQILKLEPEAFFDDINRIKKDAESQNLKVWAIRVTLFNTAVSTKEIEEIEEIEEKDLQGVPYAKAFLLFLSNDAHLMGYPILFKRYGAN